METLPLSDGEGTGDDDGGVGANQPNETLRDALAVGEPVKLLDFDKLPLGEALAWLAVSVRDCELVLDTLVVGALLAWLAVSEPDGLPDLDELALGAPLARLAVNEPVWLLDLVRLTLGDPLT